ncbi:MAG: ARPP-1 family domain-containing protein, partial [Planctomycetota bacterium]
DLKFTTAEAIAVRLVRSAGQYEKNQGSVWKQVAVVKSSALDDLSAHRDVPAFNSSSLVAVMDATSKAAAPKLDEDTRAVHRHFAAQEECIGFAYAINGEPVTVRTFAHPRLFRQQFAPFLKAMAAEAMLAAAGPAREARATDVVALVKGIADAREEMSETAGINRNGIRATRAAYASSCYVERKGKGWVPVTNDWTAR